MINKKLCPKCKKTLYTIFFSLNSLSKDGLQSWCKKCKAIQQRKYRQENRELLNSKSRIYSAKWRNKNRGKLRKQYMEVYRKRKNNPKFKELCRKNQAKYAKKYLDKISCHNIANWFKSKLKKMKCEFCGSRKELQMHHPDYSKPKEVVTLCRLCHLFLHKIRKEELK